MADDGAGSGSAKLSMMLTALHHARPMIPTNPQRSPSISMATHQPAPSVPLSALMLRSRTKLLITHLAAPTKTLRMQRLLLANRRRGVLGIASPLRVKATQVLPIFVMRRTEQNWRSKGISKLLLQLLQRTERLASLLQIRRSRVVAKRQTTSESRLRSLLVAWRLGDLDDSAAKRLTCKSSALHQMHGSAKRLTSTSIPVLQLLTTKAINMDEKSVEDGFHPQSQ